MAIPCGKRALTLTWAILECVFFSGILNGWIWLKQILKDDYFFTDNCNFTLQPSYPGTVTPQTPDYMYNTTFITYHQGLKYICMYKRIKVFHFGPIVTPATTPSAFSMNTTTIRESDSLNNTDTACLEQDEKLNLILSLIFIIRNILMLPFGIFLDRCGTSRTRIFAITFLACGSLMMLFANNNFPWLCLPALTLLSISGFLILLTDIQIANLFGARRYTVMSILVGAYHSGGFILFLMKTSREDNVSLQTSFMFMAVGIVPVLISTIALLPRSRIPWPLPLNYGTNKYSSGTKEDKYQPRDWQRRISAGGKDTEASTSIMSSMIKSSMYLWLLVWFTILSVKTFIFDMNIDLAFWNLTETYSEALHYTTMYGIMLLFSLSFSPITGVIMDWKKSFVSDPKTDQMMNIVHAIVATYVISLLSGITALLPYTGFHVLSCVLVTIEKVAALSTLCAILTHVHFPSECFGRCIGLVMCVSGSAMTLQFAFKLLIRSSFHNQTFYVNLIMLILLLFAAGHPINVWYHCKRDCIKDTSSSELKQPVTINLMNTNNDREDVETVVENVQGGSKPGAGLQVTDL